MKRNWIYGFAVLAAGMMSACSFTSKERQAEAGADDDVTVVAYYFANYHEDRRNAAYHGDGWTEWELVKDAKPRFPNHHQPNVPAWGYTDEADPVQMAQKIDAAVDHGVDVFLFDWYMYEDGPFL
ncbi:MAG: glycoside hydrolase family 99-like domain-containing protein, partial [Bacteroidota bacterium]